MRDMSSSKGSVVAKKIAFVVWARYHRRSELLAQNLGATIYYVYSGKAGNLLTAPGRYLVQAWKTLRLLVREQPDVIFVQNPPIFAVLVTCLFAQLFGKGYVIDSHTGAFVGQKWRWSLGLHRRLSRGALTTIVHNNSQEAIVRRWGCDYCVLAFTPGEYPEGGDFFLEGQFNVAVISTFSADEPLDVVFEAAGCLPEVIFYVTGDSKRIAPHLLATKPGNCYLTGYLSYGQYVSLLRGADAILDLTTQDHTLLMGAFEAVSLGTPLIVSDWPILQDYFSLGTVHVPNTVEGVCEGVRRAQREQPMLRRDMLRLRERLQTQWEHQFRELGRFLDGR